MRPNSRSRPRGAWRESAQRRRVVDDAVHRHPLVFVVGLRDGGESVGHQQLAHRRAAGLPAAAVEVLADVVALTLEAQLGEVEFEAVVTPLRRGGLYPLPGLFGVEVG